MYDHGRLGGELGGYVGEAAALRGPSPGGACYSADRSGEERVGQVLLIADEGDADRFVDQADTEVPYHGGE